MDNTYAQWNELVVNEIELIDVIWDSSYIDEILGKEWKIKQIEKKLKVLKVSFQLRIQ